jgi:hypothetical protein
MFNVQSRQVLVVAAAVVLLGSGCAATGSGAAAGSGAAPRSPAQMKQQELTQMEKQGQRKDIDKPFK